MRPAIVAAALVLLTAGVSLANGPFQFGFGWNGRHPREAYQPPISVGGYYGNNNFSVPYRSGYQQWTPNPPWSPPTPFYYYYDPSFSNYYQPSVPGVGPFDGWDAKPNNISR